MTKDKLGKWRRNKLALLKLRKYQWQARRKKASRMNHEIKINHVAGNGVRNVGL